MKIRVYRDKGDIEYPEVLVDELCTTQLIGKQKGLTFLYDEGFDRLEYNIQIKYTNNILINDIVLISDSSIGENFYARISNIKVNCQMTENGRELFHELTLQRYLSE